MDIDHFQEAVEEPLALNHQGQLKNLTSSTSASSDNSTGCFDCNICLDYAQDPIVTLCGHLYCWSCIYKWINHKNSGPQQCPVCKADLSQATIVPLYGRGDTTSRANHVSKGPSASHLEIPQRPSAYRPDTIQAPPQPQHPQQQLPQFEYQNEPYNYDHNMTPPARSLGGRSPRLFQSMSGAFGGTAIAVLPWVFGYPETGLYYSNPYYLSGSVNSPHLRRQEMQAERSLSRISAFLFCCMVLCLLLF